MFSAIKEYGIVGRAVKNGQVNIQVINPRNFTTDNYKRIDERPFWWRSWHGDDGRTA